jgi:glycine cleavage system H protein
VGKVVAEQDSTVVIESVKIAADVYTPVAGKVLKVNDVVSKDPTLVNSNAEGSWLFELSVTGEPKDLLSAEDYKKIVDSH